MVGVFARSLKYLYLDPVGNLRVFLSTGARRHVNLGRRATRPEARHVRSGGQLGICLPCRAASNNSPVANAPCDETQGFYSPQTNLDRKQSTLRTTEVCKGRLFSFHVCLPKCTSTQYLRPLVPKTIPRMVSGPRNLKYWVPVPCGFGSVYFRSRAGLFGLKI